MHRRLGSRITARDFLTLLVREGAPDEFADTE